MHHRPAVDTAIRRPVEDERGPALRLKADRRDTGERGNGVAPGTGGIDHDRRGKGALRRLRVPEVAVAAEPAHSRLRQQPAAAGPQATQIALVQGGDVDFQRLRLQHPAGDIVLAQRHGLPERLGSVEAGEARHARSVLVVQPVEGLELIGAANVEHLLRAEQRRFGKSRRRVSEEGPACGGQPPCQRTAVGLHVHGGGAPGGVIAGRVLLFEHDDAAPLGKPIRCRSPGHAGADDQEIVAFHGAHSMQHALRPKRPNAASAGMCSPHSASRARPVTLAPSSAAGADHGDIV